MRGSVAEVRSLLHEQINAAELPPAAERPLGRSALQVVSSNGLQILRSTIRTLLLMAANSWNSKLPLMNLPRVSAGCRIGPDDLPHAPVTWDSERPHSWSLPGM